MGKTQPEPAREGERESARECLHGRRKNILCMCDSVYTWANMICFVYVIQWSDGTTSNV